MLFRSPFLVADVETSGLLKNREASVVELAGVIVGPDGEEIDRLTTLVRPDRLPADADVALAVSGILRSEIEAAPTALAVHFMWKEWLERRNVRFVTSFNTQFDQPMMEDRLGLKRMKWIRCIMLAAMEIMGPAGALRPANAGHPAYDERRPWLFPSLTKKQDKKTGEWRDGAAEFFGVTLDHDQTHRALDDARIAAKVACAIRRLELERETA